MMSFFKILIGSIVFAFVVWTSLLFYGRMQSFIAYDHPLIQVKTPWIMAYGGESILYPSHTKMAFDEALKNKGKDDKVKDSDVWLAVDVFINSEKHFYAIPEGSTLPQHRAWNLLTDNEIDQLDAGLQIQNPIGNFPFKNQGLHFYKLENLLTQYPQTHFLLWFRDNIQDLDLMISSMLKKIPGLDNRILIHSDFDVVLRSLKEILPRWVYSCGIGERARFLMMESIHMEGVISLKGDVYITPLKQGVITLLNSEMRDELKRRYVPLIVGPIKSEQEFNDAARLMPQGYLTRDPTALINYLIKYK